MNQKSTPRTFARSVVLSVYAMLLLNCTTAAAADGVPPIYLNPKPSEQIKNSWFVAIWSDPREVRISSNTDFGLQTTVGGQKAVSMAVSGESVKGEIDTALASAPRSRLTSIVIKKLFDPPLVPWSMEDGGLVFSTNLAVDQYQGSGRAVSYIAATFVVKERLTSKSFWIVVQIFDPRGMSAVKTGVNCSPSRGTSLPIVSAKLSDSSLYLLPMPKSSGFAQRAFETTNFRFMISSANMQKIIGDLTTSATWCNSSDGGWSSQAGDFQLVQASLMIESYSGGTETVGRQETKIDFRSDYPDIRVVN